MADTKRKFYEAFRKPVPGLYNNIIQELLVQQHLMRFNRTYRYDEVRGVRCSLFEVHPALCISSSAWLVLQRWLPTRAALFIEEQRVIDTQ